MLRTQANAELVQQTTMLMDGASGISINMPCAPMPVPEGDAPAFMHKRLVTSLTGNQPYYMRGGLIPHLTRKGSFWKSQAPAIHTAMLKFSLHIDAVNSAHLDKMEKIDCGWMPPLPRVHHYDGNTGFISLLVRTARSRMCSIGLSRMGLPPRQPHQLHPQRPGAIQCRDSLDILSRCP